MYNSTSELEAFIDDNYLWIGIIITLSVVDAILKIITLWQSARGKQILWFIFLALINSLCILPVVYLIMNRKKDKFRV